jgi:hypothetical protein
MKKFLFFIGTLLTIIVISSCSNKQDEPITSLSNYMEHNLYYDTLLIHGHKHEFIREPVYVSNVYVHSPECWCMKKHNQESSDNDYSDLDDEDIEEYND